MPMLKSTASLPNSAAADLGADYVPRPARGALGSRAKSVTDFCECLPVPTGKLFGQTISLLPYQRSFIRSIYGSEDDTGRRKVRTAILSVGRKNGKSAFAAALGLAHLIGPERVPSSAIIVAANEREQAGILYKMASDMVRRSPVLSARLTCIDSTKRIVNRRDNITMFAISAKASTKLGFGPELVIYDEIGSAPNRLLYDTLRTSQNAAVDPLFLMISTQAANDTHFFSELIDYGRSINRGDRTDPTFVVHLHAVPQEVDVFDERNWGAANPALGIYYDRAMLAKDVEQARNMPSAEMSMRNLLMNQRVHASSPFLSRGVWLACSDAPNDTVLRAGPCFGGLDLSSRKDLTALVLAAVDEMGVVHVKPWIWTPAATMNDRALIDRVPYDIWARDGVIEAVPGASIDYSFVAERIARICDEYHVANILYDRWRIEDLRRELGRIGAAPPLMEFGQGFRDMSVAIDELEAVVVAKRLCHGGHPALTWCVSNCVTIQNTELHRKFNKANDLGRIDAAVAMTMAVYAACRVDDVNISAMIG